MRRRIPLLNADKIGPDIHLLKDNTMKKAMNCKIAKRSLNSNGDVRNIVMEAANDNQEPILTVLIPDDDTLLRSEIYFGLGKLVDSLGLSRRQFGEFLLEKLIDPRYVFVSPGTRIRFYPKANEIDRRFKDAGFRWISTFVAASRNTPLQSRQRPQERMRHRLRLIAIAMTVHDIDKAMELFKITNKAAAQAAAFIFCSQILKQFISFFTINFRPRNIEA